MKYFLDTNIILDILIDSRKNYKVARTLLDEIKRRDSKAELWIDRDSISTIDYLLRKEMDKNLIVKEIIKSFNIANDIDILLESSNIANNYNLDYEDVVKVKTAEKIDAVLFITEDKKLLKSDNFKINLMSIEQILVQFGYEKNLIGEFKKITNQERKTLIRKKYANLIADAQDETSITLLMEQAEDELKNL